MITVIPMLIGFAIILMMTTAGSVLFLKFWVGHLSPTSRILIAALAGSFIPLFSLMSFVLIEGGMMTEMLIAGFVGAAMPAVIIGWPVAFLATRKIDRLTEQSASVFE